MDGAPRWFVGELMEAEAAAAKYHELTGIGGYYPKDPALLSWRSQGHLALQVFPVPPGDRKTVSYTLQMPTAYRDGRHELTIPALGMGGAPARVTIRPLAKQDHLLVDGQPFPAGGRLMTEGDPATIALVPAAAPAVGGALGATEIGDDRALVSYRIDAAPRLGRVPRDAQVVIILDWSRSLDQRLCESGVNAAGAFLRHFAGASVEVLTVDRQVHRRHGRLVPVGRALSDLTTLAVQRRNGSNLDLALAQADHAARRRARRSRTSRRPLLRPPHARGAGRGKARERLPPQRRPAACRAHRGGPARADGRRPRARGRTSRAPPAACSGTRPWQAARPRPRTAR